LVPPESLSSPGAAVPSAEQHFSMYTIAINMSMENV